MPPQEANAHYVKKTVISDWRLGAIWTRDGSSREEGFGGPWPPSEDSGYQKTQIIAEDVVETMRAGRLADGLRDEVLLRFRQVVSERVEALQHGGHDVGLIVLT